MNAYRDYLKLGFDKVFWSRLVPIHIAKDGLYRCNCCNKYPHECKNEKSATEYNKIRQIVEKECDAFGVSNYLFPIKQTGYLRADLFADANLIWKVQRELARVAGFTLARSSFY